MPLLPASALARDGVGSDVVRLVSEHDVFDIRDRNGLTVVEVQDRVALVIDVDWRRKVVGRAAVESQRIVAAAAVDSVVAIGVIGDVDRVMDGDLDPFIRSYLMAKKTKGKLDIQPDDDADAA